MNKCKQFAKEKHFWHYKNMNYIWFFIIIISIISALYTGKVDAMVNSIWTGAKQSVEICLYLAGIMAFWLGIMKIAEKSGMVSLVAKIITPVARKLFPDIPENNRAIGDIAMNFSANAFGLANAATPIGIRAMEELQKLNRDKKSASNDMCTLLAMNTAGFQLVPTTVIAVLAACGDKNPSSIVLPTLLVTSVTFLFALVIVKLLEKISPAQPDLEKEGEQHD